VIGDITGQKQQVNNYQFEVSCSKAVNFAGDGASSCLTTKSEKEKTMKNRSMINGSHLL
jgi:hypothetical protein